MTNFEKHKEIIRELAQQGNGLAMKDGILESCDDINECENCDFNDAWVNCDAKTLLWLLEDDGTPSAEREEGRKEAWELAKKIGTTYADEDFLSDDFKNIFGVSFIYEVFESHSYAEAAEKVKAWEERKKFEVGDVVRRDELYGVVTGFVGNTYCVVITQYGFRESWYISDCIRTARTLPVSDWLRQIGGEE